MSAERDNRSGGFAVIVLLATARAEPPAQPAVAIDPPDELAAALRLSGVLAWCRRREPSLFDNFLSVLMPDPDRRARRRRDSGRAEQRAA